VSAALQRSVLDCSLPAGAAAGAQHGQRCCHPAAPAAYLCYHSL